MPETSWLDNAPFGDYTGSDSLDRLGRHVANKKRGPVTVEFIDGTGRVFGSKESIVSMADTGSGVAVVITTPLDQGIPGYLTSMIPLTSVREVTFYHEQPEPFQEVR